jgi:hypothetical protein
LIYYIRFWITYFTKSIYSFFTPNWIDIVVVRTGVDTYVASAFDGTNGVYNNYGSTHDKAKEMALWNLKQCYEREKTPLE